MRILLITNDYPPRVGGIQVYLENIYRRLAVRHQVTVFAAAHPDAAAFDAAQPYEIVRHDARIYWPRRDVARRAADLARDADLVAFGAVLPMNTIARSLNRPYVIHTHGFEIAWTRIPGLGAALRRIAAPARLVTVVSEYTRRSIAPAVGNNPRVELLKTGVDLDAFHPGVDGSEVRKRYGLDGRPVVACISRLVPRKGQDTIIEAMWHVCKEIPDAAALIVGDGPARKRLEALASKAPAHSVVFAGEVTHADLPAHFAAADVFAMPCRSRYAGLEVEGLGLVYLEALATGKPAVAGDSGGAPEAIVPGETGEVVEGGNARELARVLTTLLSESDRAARMGRAGRAFVEAHHRWDDVVARYEHMLEEVL